MNRTDYMEKMTQLLENETYRPLKRPRNPNPKVETKISRALKQLEAEGQISDKEKKYLSIPIVLLPTTDLWYHESAQRRHAPQAHSQCNWLTNLQVGQDPHKNPFSSHREDQREATGGG